MAVGCAAVELLQTKEICCRAWSSDMNTQPNSFTWNLMGMMNNCVYRVKVHPSVTNGALALRYEHPTLAGPALGGWMNRAEDKPAVEEVSHCQNETILLCQILQTLISWRVAFYAQS